MFNNLINITFFIYFIFGLGAQSKTVTNKTFTKALESFDKALQLIGDDRLSPAQKEMIAERIQLLENKQYEEASDEESNVPEYCKTLHKSEEGKQLILSPAKKRSIDEINNGLPVSKKQKKLLAEAPENLVYIQSNFFNDYFSNYIEHENRIDVGLLFAQLKLNFPKAKPVELEKRVLLHIEKHFILLIKENPMLMKAVHYVGLAKDDSNRGPGHGSDLRNEIKCSNNEKAKTVTEFLEYTNIRMNTILYNIPNYSKCPLYEKLLAEIFQVQVNGYSAVIANEAATKTYLQYVSWQVRIDELAKNDLENVVKEASTALCKKRLAFDNP